MADQTKHVSELTGEFQALKNNMILYAYDQDDNKDKRLPGNLLTGLGTSIINFGCLINGVFRTFAEIGNEIELTDSVRLEAYTTTKEIISTILWTIEPTTGSVLTYRGSGCNVVFTSPGTYKVTVTAKGALNNTLATTTVTNYFIVNSVTQPETYTVNVNTKDALGVKVLDAIVTLTGDGVYQQKTSNSVTGDVQFTGVPVGAYNLVATKTNYVNAGENFTLTAANSSNVHYLELDINVTIQASAEIDPSDEDNLLVTYTWVPDQASYEGATTIELFKDGMALGSAQVKGTTPNFGTFTGMTGVTGEISAVVTGIDIEGTERDTDTAIVYLGIQPALYGFLFNETDLDTEYLNATETFTGYFNEKYKKYTPYDGETPVSTNILCSDFAIKVANKVGLGCYKSLSIQYATEISVLFSTLNDVVYNDMEINVAYPYLLLPTSVFPIPFTKAYQQGFGSPIDINLNWYVITRTYNDIEYTVYIHRGAFMNPYDLTYMGSSAMIPNYNFKLT